MSSAFAALAKTLATITLRPYIGSVVRNAYNERQPIRKRLQSEAREKEKRFEEELRRIECAAENGPGGVGGERSLKVRQPGTGCEGLEEDKAWEEESEAFLRSFFFGDDPSDRGGSVVKTDVPTCIDVIPVEPHQSLRSKPLSSPVEIHYHNIRGISRTLRTDDITGPLPFLSHWSVVINNIHCELRAGGQDALIAPHVLQSRNIIYQEAGYQRKIRLVVSRKRPDVSRHKNKKWYIGETTKDIDTIIKIASLVLCTIGSQYDLWIDNCQAFVLQLCVALCSRSEDTLARLRSVERKTSLLAPMIASEVFKPIYWAYCTVPAILRMDLGLTADIIGEARYQALLGNAEERLAKWDLFLHHAKVWEKRRRVRRDIAKPMSLGNWKRWYRTGKALLKEST